ncbi:MAG: tRNA pseudouridine(38-40) synthase TruA [Chloroflexi bacterium RBG_16_57_8]|nr:MAG: tRNA pseudouridine(38-40) synthase TruA [Chloroflexi bacterium RBG_16_57_8]
MVVEYDGTAYCGFQWQDGQPTVQDELEKAIWRLTSERTRVVATSRTDTGVHAKGQVVSFRTASTLRLSKFVSGLNYYLPADIAVKAAHRPAETFHVRRSAVSRQYEYRILNRPARSPLQGRQTWLVNGALNAELMGEACRAFVGEHDFASFTSGSGTKIENTVRRVYRADVAREGELVVFTIVASSFLPHQIRNMVGALVRVGLGQMSVGDFCSIMEQKQPGLAGPKAPAAGLCLVRVNYPDPTCFSQPPLSPGRGPE